MADCLLWSLVGVARRQGRHATSWRFGVTCSCDTSTTEPGTGERPGDLGKTVFIHGPSRQRTQCVHTPAPPRLEEGRVVFNLLAVWRPPRAGVQCSDTEKAGKGGEEFRLVPSDLQILLAERTRGAGRRCVIRFVAARDVI